MSGSNSESNYAGMFDGVHCTKEEYKRLRSFYTGLANDEYDRGDIERTLRNWRNTITPAHVESTTMSASVAGPEPVVADSVAATLAQRGSRYGDFTDHAGLAQGLMFRLQKFNKPADNDQGYTEPWKDRLNDVQRQALTVIMDKIARILTGDPNYDDNWHDIQGYAKLVEDRLPCNVNKETH